MELMTINEVCKAIGVTRCYVYTLARRGVFTIVKIGKLSRIPREEYEAFVSARIAEAKEARG